MFYRWKPYVSAAEKRMRAQRALARMAKRGEARNPIVVEGRNIATTFWGKAWCDNIEGYSDFYNRLGRGRSYVRSGAVLDLQVKPGAVTARVMGTRLYSVEVKIAAVARARWNAVCKACSGAIDSLIELLQARFSKSVMEHICSKETGLFPAPKEITFTCSCPDWASMCKHVAAVLYGIGARLDTEPQLLFSLRKVDHNELIAKAASDLPVNASKSGSAKRHLDGELSEIFGVEMADITETVAKKRIEPRARAAVAGDSRNAAKTRSNSMRKRRPAAPTAAGKVKKRRVPERRS